MKTYIPSEEELVELGFFRETGSWSKKIEGNHKYEYITYDSENGWGFGYNIIYPRDKAHLESIILAFKKP